MCVLVSITSTFRWYFISIASPSTIVVGASGTVSKYSKLFSSFASTDPMSRLSMISLISGLVWATLPDLAWQVRTWRREISTSLIRILLELCTWNFFYLVIVLIKFSHLTLAPKDVLLQQSMVFKVFIAKLADFLLGKK